MNSFVDVYIDDERGIQNFRRISRFVRECNMNPRLDTNSFNIHMSEVFGLLACEANEPIYNKPPSYTCNLSVNTFQVEHTKTIPAYPILLAHSHPPLTIYLILGLFLKFEDLIVFRKGDSVIHSMKKGWFMPRNVPGVGCGRLCMWGRVGWGGASHAGVGGVRWVLVGCRGSCWGGSW